LTLRRDDEQEDTVAGTERGGSGRLLRRLAAVLLAVALVCLVAAGLIATRYQTVAISDNSMQPTFRPGDKLLVDNAGGQDVRRGDVVLIHAPRWGLVGSPYQLDRVVGVGGDQLACCDAAGQLRRNGQVLTEPYLMADDGSAPVRSFSISVPAGRLYLLGDNRAAASDSRDHSELDSGTVPVDAVTGRVVAVLLPIERAGRQPLGGSRPGRMALWQLAAALAAGGGSALLVAAAASRLASRRPRR
jgi:signal peptidase I